MWSTTCTVWPSLKCSSAAVDVSTATWPGPPGRCPDATVKPRSAGSPATLMPTPGSSPFLMTLPSLPTRGARPTRRPAADSTPRAARTWDSTAGGIEGSSGLPGRSDPGACGVTAASTFLAPAAKLVKYAWFIEAPITRVPETKATPRPIARQDSISRAVR